MGDGDTVSSVVGSSLFDKVRLAFPPVLLPTSRTPKFFAVLFVLVVLVGMFQFPLFSFGSSRDTVVSVGFPFSFLVFDLGSPEVNPLRFGGLIFDLFLYVVVAYVFDVLLSVLLGSRMVKSGDDRRALPKVFADQKTPAPSSVTSNNKKVSVEDKGKSASFAEKIAHKMFEKDKKV